MSTQASAPSSVNAFGAWVNGSNTYASDNQYATLTTSASSSLDLRGFDFSAIPAGSTITAVTVALEHYESQTNQITFSVVVMDDVTTINTLSVTPRLSEGTDTLSMTSLPTLAQLQSATFQVRLTGAKSGGSGSRSFTVDSVLVTATYTATINGTIADTLADTTMSFSGSVSPVVNGTIADTLADTTMSASGTVTLSGSMAAVTLEPATMDFDGNAAAPPAGGKSINFVEMRLYNGDASSYSLLPHFETLTFDVKYNDLGSLSFTYPLLEAKTLGIGDQSLVGLVLGFSDGTSAEVERYVLDGSSNEIVKDDTRLKSLSGKSSEILLDDAFVYSSNWHSVDITYRSRTTNVATLTIGADHGFFVGQKVFVAGISDATFNGEQTITVISPTTISYANTGTNVGTTATTGTVQTVAPSGHEFADATVGTIMRTLIARAHGRGALTNVNETTFTGTQDSNNVVWGTLHTQNYSTGQYYWSSVLSDFAKRGLIDVWMDGWDLQILNGGTRGQHVAINVLEIRPAYNATELSTTTQSTESISTVLIEGDAGTALERHNASFESLLGRRRERYVSQGGISDAGVLTLLADAELSLHARIPSEETVGISMGSMTPFLDFGVADWVWVRFETDEAPVERRIYQLGGSVDADRNITFGVTLNSILYESDVALQRKIDAYVGGGGSYGSTPNTALDLTVPNAPTTLDITSGTFISTRGEYTGAFTASWVAPTHNTDGTTISDLSGYELQWRYTGDVDWSFILPSVDTSIQYSPVTPGRHIDVRVRALDTNDHVSEWLLTTDYTLDQDTTGPSTPSTPDAQGGNGVVEIVWDGLTNSGGAMESDFAAVEIWMSPSTGFTPGVGDAVKIGEMGGAGTFDTSAPTVGTTMFYKLRSRDKAGNIGGTSAQDSAVMQPFPVDPGTAPDSSPTPEVDGGIGVLYARWEPVASDYPVTYDLYCSTISGFTASLTSLVGTTNATLTTIRRMRENLIVNGDFESPAVGGTLIGSDEGTYGVSSGTLVTTTEQVALGTQAAKYTTGGGTGTATISRSGTDVTVSQGINYMYAIRMRSAVNTRNFRARVIWKNAGGTTLRTDDTPLVASSTSAFVTSAAEFTAPSTATRAALSIVLDSTGATEVHYLDGYEFVSSVGDQPLNYDTNYYVRMIARVGSLAAAAGTQVGPVQLQRATNEEISAEYVYAGEISADKITGGTLNAEYVMGGTLQTADSGQRTVIDASGLTQYGPDGVTAITFFPNDSGQTAFIQAIVEAKTLTVTDGLEIRGGASGENVFAMGSRTILNQSISAPPAPPSLASGYPRAIDVASIYNPPYGFWINEAETEYYRTACFFSTGQLYHLLSGTGRYYTWPYVTDINGNNQRSTLLPVGGSAPVSVGPSSDRVVIYGQTVVQGYVNPTDIDNVVRLYDASPMIAAGGVAPTQKWEVKVSDYSATFNQSFVGRCYSAIGSSTRASWYCRASVHTNNPNPSRTIDLYAYSVTDSGQTQQVARLGVALSFFTVSDEALRGVAFGSSAKMGFTGTDQDVWVIHSQYNSYVLLDGTTPSRQPGRDFPTFTTAPHFGCGGDITNNTFTNFYAKTWDSNLVYRYSNIDWDAATSPLWWGSYTWYDSNGTTHESAMSSLSSLTMIKRASLYVTVPTLPDPAAGKGEPRDVDDVNSFRFYLTRGASQPTRTGVYLQTAPADLATSLILTSPTWSGTNPPASSNFPSTSPAIIESNALGTGDLPKIQLTGEGFAHFEALDVGGNGQTSFTGKAFDQLYYAIRAQAMVAGGGTKYVDASGNIKWSQRFIVISFGRGSTLATDGYFDITAPVSQSITGYGGASDRTSTSGGYIALGSWEALWYELPYGSAHASVPGNFRVTNYTSDYVVPNNWVLLAQRNPDLSPDSVQFVTGEEVWLGYDSLQYNIGGQRIRKFNIASYTFTTDTSGAHTVPHGLGTTPTQVLVTPGGSGGGIRVSNVGTFGATTFNITLHNAADNSSYTTSGTTVSVYFLAIAE